MAEDILNLKVDMDMQIQDAQCRISSETHQDTLAQTSKAKDIDRIFFKKCFIYYFRERGREGEREGEKQ